MSYDDTDLQTLEVAHRAWPPPPPGTTPEPAAAPPTRPFPFGPAITALIVAMLIAGITGFAITYNVRGAKDFNSAVGNGSGSGSSGGSGGGSGSRSPGRSTVDPDEAVLGGLNVRQRDVGNDIFVTLLPGGDSTDGATLDLCNGVYASERLRTARRQVVAVNANASTVLSTEAVLYGRPADTQQAFGELRDVARTCPNELVPSHTGGDTYRTKFGPPPDSSWTGFGSVQRLAYDLTTTDATGTSSHTVAVYLRRGRVFLGLYFGTAARVQPRIAGHTTIESISRAFAARVAKLPASVING